MLDKLVVMARRQHASDLHLEAGLPPAARVNGRLRTLGEAVRGQALHRLARELVPGEEWGRFLARRSYDLSRVIAGVPCRINVFQTARGVAFAIRLLASVAPSLEELNLHPDIGELVRRSHGLILVAGPTGSGKSSTLAALVQTLNRERACHILAIEQPIEYHFRPQRAFIRQREVGRDTPSFAQALTDALREDPDVLVVGEMRHRETMQLTLDAAETGHLVLATLHATSPTEALQRIVSAFAPESQHGVLAQLASSLAAVVTQTLEYRPEHQLRVPECEILTANDAVRANIREGQLFKLPAAMEIGARFGMWTRERYRRWLAERRGFVRPAPSSEPIPAVRPEVPLPPLTATGPTAAVPRDDPTPATAGPPVVEIDDDVDIDDLIAQLKGR